MNSNKSKEIVLIKIEFVVLRNYDLVVQYL